MGIGYSKVGMIESSIPLGKLILVSANESVGFFFHSRARDEILHVLMLFQLSCCRQPSESMSLQEHAPKLVRTSTVLSCSSCHRNKQVNHLEQHITGQSRDCHVQSWSSKAES